MLAFGLRTRLALTFPFSFSSPFSDRFAFSVACCDKRLSKINFQLNWLLVDGRAATPRGAWRHLAARGSSVPVSCVEPAPRGAGPGFHQPREPFTLLQNVLSVKL